MFYRTFLSSLAFCIFCAVLNTANADSNSEGLDSIESFSIEGALGMGGGDQAVFVATGETGKVMESDFAGSSSPEAIANLTQSLSSALANLNATDVITREKSLEKVEQTFTAIAEYYKEQGLRNINILNAEPLATVAGRQESLRLAIASETGNYSAFKGITFDKQPSASLYILDWRNNEQPRPTKAYVFNVQGSGSENYKMIAIERTRADLKKEFEYRLVSVINETDTAITFDNGSNESYEMTKYSADAIFAKPDVINNSQNGGNSYSLTSFEVTQNGITESVTSQQNYGISAHLPAAKLAVITDFGRREGMGGDGPSTEGISIATAFNVDELMENTETYSNPSKKIVFRYASMETKMRSQGENYHCTSSSECVTSESGNLSVSNEGKNDLRDYVLKAGDYAESQLSQSNLGWQKSSSWNENEATNGASTGSIYANIGSNSERLSGDDIEKIFGFIFAFDDEENQNNNGYETIFNLSNSYLANPQFADELINGKYLRYTTWSKLSMLDDRDELTLNTQLYNCNNGETCVNAYRSVEQQAMDAYFVAGVLTDPANLPTTNVTYSGNVYGSALATNWFENGLLGTDANSLRPINVNGNINLIANFGAGTMTGNMNLQGQGINLSNIQIANGAIDRINSAFHGDLTHSQIIDSHSGISGNFYGPAGQEFGASYAVRTQDHLISGITVGNTQ